MTFDGKTIYGKRSRELSLRIAACDIWASWPVSHQVYQGASKVLMNRIELDY